MSPPGKVIDLAAKRTVRPLIGGISMLARIALFCSIGASAASATDGYFSPSGVDSAGNTIGRDCTYVSPCKTVAKALSLLAANIAGGVGPNHNYIFAFEGASSNGPFVFSDTLILTSAHTVSPGYTTTFDVITAARRRGAAAATPPAHGHPPPCRAAPAAAFRPILRTLRRSREPMRNTMSAWRGSTAIASPR
jgi:hypothetical protein